MELCSCASLDGRGVWGRMNTCICMAESLCCSPETTTTLLIRHFVVQSLSHVRLFATLWTARLLCPPLSLSLLKVMSIESVMLSNHLILCCPLLLLPLIFPSIRVFSNELALHIWWPEDWSLSFSNSPSDNYSGLISFRIDGLISLQSKGLSRVFSSTTV